MKRSVIHLAGVALATLLATGLWAQQDAATPDGERGAQLFATHCSACHGETGAGDGPVASLLDPRPRDFGLGAFHVVSTDNGVPSDDDLADTLRLGMVGTAMPGWSHLPDSDLAALVGFVREAIVQRRLETALSNAGQQSPASAAETERQIRDALAPGARVPVGPAPPSTPADIARGREIWAESCAECHGMDGRGGVRTDLRDIRGRPSHPRDFSRGLFRGSDEPVELARRITLGMPGTAMPSFELPAEDLWAVVHYGRSLVEAGAQQDRLQIRRTLVAPRSRAALSLDAAPRLSWDFVPQVRLPLMPYVWDGPDFDPVGVQLMHDGQRLAVRVHGLGAGEQDAPSELTLKISTESEPALISGRSTHSSSRSWRWSGAQADEAGRDGAAHGQSTPEGWQLLFVDELGGAAPVLRPGESVRLQLSLRGGSSKGRALTIWHAVDLAP